MTDFIDDMIKYDEQEGDMNGCGIEFKCIFGMKDQAGCQYYQKGSILCKNMSSRIVNGEITCNSAVARKDALIKETEKYM